MRIGQTIFHNNVAHCILWSKADGSSDRLSSQSKSSKIEICSSRGSFKTFLLQNMSLFCHLGTVGPLTSPIVRMKSCEKTLVLAGLTIDYLKRWEKTSKFLLTNCLSEATLWAIKTSLAQQQSPPFASDSAKVSFLVNFGALQKHCKNIARIANAAHCHPLLKGHHVL